MENFFKLCVEIGVSSTIKNSKFQLKQLFKNITLKNKRILDVGGGSGYISFYCMLNGAQSAICLEPGEEGFDSHKNQQYNLLNENLNYNINYLNKKIEDYNSRKKYDIIILHNSINHLVEGNCKDLKNNISARDKIMKTFDKISSLANHDCLLIIVDNSGYHFFQNFGLQHHPLIPHVGFHDHESANFWIKLIEFYNFKSIKTDYITPNTLRGFGKFFFNNLFSSYLFGFPFRLLFKFNNTNEN